MKITVLENGKVTLENSGKPVVEEDEALIKVRACGVCGSDVPRVFSKKSYYYPIVLGHEFSGEVMENGGEWQGKRVCVFPLLPCKKCAFCKKEQWANCVQYDYYGSRRDGGMQEWIAVKRENLVELPKNVSYLAGAMAEPTAVCLHAMKKAQIKAGESVVIYGAGTIGLLCGMWAKSFGAKEVYFVEIDDKKMQMAISLGFKAYQKQAVEIAVEASGAGVCLNKAFATVEALGRVIIVGNVNADMEIKKENYAQILRKQLSIYGSWNSDFSSTVNDWKESLQAIAEKKIQPEQLITHVFPLDKGDKAFEVIKNREFYNKIMVVNEQCMRKN